MKGHGAQLGSDWFHEAKLAFPCQVGSEGPQLSGGTKAKAGPDRKEKQLFAHQVYRASSRLI